MTHALPPAASNQTRTATRIARVAVLAVTAISAFLAAALVLAHGPTAAWRLVALGDSSIHDHAAFPARALRPAAEALPVTADLQPDLAEAATRHLGTDDLEAWLSETGTIAFLAVEGRTIVHEWYPDDRSPADVSQVFSVTKSVTSALIGAAVADGLVASVDQPVTDHVPELAASGFADLSIRDLLQMRSGMDYVENDNPFGRHVTFNYTDRLEQEILALTVPPDRETGFRYRSGDAALLGLILSRAVAPMSVTDYAQERLWEPLGMVYGGLWNLDREDGLERTWCCLAATARDLARIGMLYRDLGAVDGRQILSADWIDASLLSPFDGNNWGSAGDFAGMSGYGYQWWLGDSDGSDFAAIGKDGQFLYVDRRSGMVFVRLGASVGAPGMLGWTDLFRALSAR